MRISWELLKDDKNKFIVLDDNISDLGSNSSHKSDAIFNKYCCRVAPTTTSICLCTGWLIGNVKRRYLRYEVSGDHFCVRSMPGLDSVTSGFSVSFFYFRLMNKPMLNL